MRLSGCRFIADFEGWVIADDSGLEVDALGGAPGVYSARYSGKEATDAENNALLLKNLENVRGKDRKARFRCVIALARAGYKVAAFSGTVEGIITNRPKGAGGFGYDPLFVPRGFCKTFGQLPAAAKNNLSHRAMALEGFVNGTDGGEWATRRFFNYPTITGSVGDNIIAPLLRQMPRFPFRAFCFLKKALHEHRSFFSI
jgi:non-canonical purine NTP pyrophosphatase (RdgB/HAM1 family)